MPKFTIGQPITTNEPDIEVEVSRDNPLPPGRHRFRLIVVDDAGQESAPDEVEVIVVDESRPTAVLDGPRSVAHGASFSLSGRRSFDAPPGKIASV